MWQYLQRQFKSHIRYKIIAPYLILVLALMALLGALAFWIVANNLQAELDQSLQRAASNTSTSLEVIENDIIDDMRLITTAPGNPAEQELSTAEAFARNNTDEIERIVRLGADYNELSRVLAIEIDGTVVVDHFDQQQFAETPSLEGTTVLASNPLVQAVLNGEVDTIGDKYASLLRFGDSNSNTMLFVIAPVKLETTNGEEEVVGAIAVLEPLSGILEAVNQQNQASITVVLNGQGEAIASYPPAREGFDLAQDQLVALQTGDGLNTNVSQGELIYQVVYNPLRLRRTLDGYFAVALPRDGISEAWTQTWWAVVVIGVISLLTIAIMGSQVTRSITRPLYELATTALQVKSGDLERRSNVDRSDELGTLSSVLNEMTDRLLDLYRTSRQVGGELSIPGVFVQTSAAINRLVENCTVIAYVQHPDGWRRYNEYSSEPEPVELDFKSETLVGLPHVADRSTHHIVLETLYTLEPQTQLVLPLKTQQQMIGMLLLISEQPIQQHTSLDEPLTAIASMTATAINNALLYTTVQNEAIRKQAILQSIADGVVVLDADREVILINDTASTMLQTTSEAALGRKFDSFELEPIQSSSELFSQSSKHAAELYQIGQFTLTVSAAPVQDEAGRLVGEVLVLHDVTAEREVDKAKTDFIATISHELRTPLTTITGYSDLMLRGFVGTLDGEQKEFIGIIRQHAQSMSEVLNNVIIIASIDAGTMTPEIAAHPISAIIDQAVATTRKPIEDKNLSLHIAIPEDLPEVWVDRDHVKIVLLQLLDNARRYTTEGSITIQAELADQFMKLNIIDTGGGISIDQQQRLFKRFQRGGEQGGLATRERGTGLGLAIARLLMEALGGQVSMEKTSESGTTFSIMLPLAHSDHLQSDQDPYTMALTS